MKLWIRSQDKKLLIPINKIISVTCDGLFYDGIILGIYKTEERALEVLDEIQSYLINNTFAKKINGLGEIKDIVQNPLFVYQMPKK